MPIVDSHCHVSLSWYEPVEVLLEWACDAFGASRMMWGSDYPPVSSREGYRNALRMPMEQLAARPEAERGEIFGGTALRVFHPLTYLLSRTLVLIFERSRSAVVSR